MSFLWFSAGVKNDFDAMVQGWSGGVVPWQCTGTDYKMRTGVYIGGYIESGLYKILPESTENIWCSYYAWVDGGRNTTPVMQIRGNAAASFQTYVEVMVESNLLQVYAYINGSMTKVATGTTPVAAGTAHQIEVYALRKETTGLITVWLDGVLEVSFTGNTGTAANFGAFGARFPGTGIWNMYNTYCAEFIATNQGRIGKKRMQLMYLSGAGDVNTTDGFMDVMGNDTATTATTVKTGMYIIPQAARADGVVKAVAFNLSAADTVKVGVFSKKPSAAIFTPDAARQISLSCAAGANTLYEGVLLPTWSIAAGEYIGIYTSAGTLIYESTSSNGDSLNLASGYCLAGADAFALGTEQAYTTDSASIFVKAFAQYLTPTNIMYLFNKDVNVLTEKTWQEGKRYMAMGANGQEFLNTCTDITDTECTKVSALKVTIRGEAGTDIDNGQISIKIDDAVTYSDTIAMPGTVNKRYAYFQGIWTQQQAKSLQVGFKALT